MRVNPAPAFALALTLVAGIWFWNLTGTLPDGKTRIEFLDAGGAATFIRTPNGTRILIDGGANPSATLSAVGQRLPFWDRTIDLLIVTDVDDEHLAGAVSAIERFDVRQIVQPAVTGKTAAYQKWRALITHRGAPTVNAQAGLRIEVDRGVTLEVLYPAEGTRPAVARLRAGNLLFLFADSASIEDQAALESDDIASTVLIAPRKLTKEFLDAVNPQFAVLFVGSGERAKPPADLLGALANTTLLRTDERGRIEMIVDGNALRVNTAK
jgi:competence protein ComEC